MPRFMSPMIRRKPVTDKLDEESRAVDSRAVSSAGQESAQSTIKQSAVDSHVVDLSAVDSRAVPSASQEAAQSTIKQSADFSQSAQSDQQQSEPETPPDIRISEGSFKQIRDESLVLLSQGITHRIDRSEEGPFQIFVEPDKRRAAQFQIRLYHRENPPRDENPPLPLKFTFQPLWVLAVPVITPTGKSTIGRISSDSPSSKRRLRLSLIEHYT